MVWGQQGTVHPSLASLVDNIKSKVSREALFYRLQAQESVNFMAACLEQVVKAKVCVSTLNASILDKFNRVLIVDSSSWDVHPALRRTFKGSGGNASAANCKIQTCYEYKSGELSFLDLTKGTYPDSKYTAKLPKHLSEGDLMLFDMGYFSIKTFRKITKKGAHFISRLKINSCLRRIDTDEKIDLSKLLGDKEIDVHDMEVVLGENKRNSTKCRFIALRVPKDVSEERHRKLKKRAQKKGKTPSARQLQMCDWTLLITNIDKSVLSDQQVLDTYGLRWQIELVFKQLKSVLNIDKSNTKSPNRLKCEVYGKMILAIIIHRTHAVCNGQLWKMCRRELSFNKLYKRVQERAKTILDYLLYSTKKAINYLK